MLSRTLKALAAIVAATTFVACFGTSADVPAPAEDAGATSPTGMSPAECAAKAPPGTSCAPNLMLMCPDNAAAAEVCCNGVWSYQTAVVGKSCNGGGTTPPPDSGPVSKTCAELKDVTTCTVEGSFYPCGDGTSLECCGGKLRSHADAMALCHPVGTPDTGVPSTDTGTGTTETGTPGGSGSATRDITIRWQMPAGFNQLPTPAGLSYPASGVFAEFYSGEGIRELVRLAPNSFELTVPLGIGKNVVFLLKRYFDETDPGSDDLAFPFDAGRWPGGGCDGRDSACQYTPGCQSGQLNTCPNFFGVVTVSRKDTGAAIPVTLVANSDEFTFTSNGTFMVP